MNTALSVLVMVDSEHSSSKNHPHHLVELCGLGKEVWERLDAQTYLNQMRDE